MSRIGKKRIELPDGVTASFRDGIFSAKGSKGELSFSVPDDINVVIEDKEVVCSVAIESKKSVAIWGTVRARIANLIEGVSNGFTKQLELHGVGYRASLKGKNLELLVGFSHPVLVAAPEGIEFQVEDELVTVAGIDKVQVGQIAANIRSIRKPEPYKGKGIRYKGEVVRRKVGKVVGTTA